MIERCFSIDGDYYEMLEGRNKKEWAAFIMSTDGAKEVFEDGEEHVNVTIAKCNFYEDKGSQCCEDVIEVFQRLAYEDGGEWAEDYLCDLTKEDTEFLEKELDKAWDKFKKERNKKANFYKAYDEKEYILYPDGTLSERVV